MTTNHQKSRELAQLQKALSLIGIASYCIIEEDRESPDFILEIDNKTIGIEVTELYRNLGVGNSAKTESDLPIIVEEALKVYDKMGGIPLAFWACFDGKTAVARRKAMYQELGEALYNYTSNDLTNGISTMQRMKPNINKYPLLSSVNEVFVLPTDSTSSVGSVVSGFNSILIDDNYLETTLNKKEALLSKYREACQNIWLLIVLPAMNLASDFRMPEKKLVTTNILFDAVYLLDDYRNQILRIKSA